MSQIWVSAIPPSEIEALWPSVIEHLKKAASYTYGRCSVENIKELTTNATQVLWVAFDKTNPIGAVTTTFAVYPQKTYLEMVFCGGERLTEWKAPMLSILRDYAKRHGCCGIESTGRPGWARIFAGDGYKHVWHTYELPLDEGYNGQE